MKHLGWVIAIFALFAAPSCSNDVREPENVAGSRWLTGTETGGIYDVLSYPATEDELAFFEEALPSIEAAAKAHPEDWERISTSEDPVEAAARNPVWKEAGVSGADFIAASLKLTFLWEFASADEAMEAEMKENLAWLEGRLEDADESSELWETTNSLRALVEVVDAHREAGAFAFYEQNQARIDAALDRFTSIGDQ